MIQQQIEKMGEETFAAAITANHVVSLATLILQGVNPGTGVLAALMAKVLAETLLFVVD